MTDLPRRVLLIGSGRRIQNNFLPALSRLQGSAEITALWSRTPAHADAVGGCWNVPVTRSISRSLADVDTVIVSVSANAVHSVREALLPRSEHLALVVDTPIFGSARHLPAMRLLRRFSKVVVAEDYVHFPQWALARRAIAAGLIGRVRSIELCHSGYRYHGLALIRSFLGWQFARYMRRIRANGRTTMQFTFDDGVVCNIVEPYDQCRGSTVVSGTKGRIVFAASENSLAPQQGVHNHGIEILGPDGEPEAFTLGEYVQPLPDVAPLLALDTPDKTLFNALKTCGLLAVLSELWNTAPPVYDYRQALYDHLTTAWLRSVPGALDLAAARQINFVDGLDWAMSLLPVATPRSPSTA
jgi:predicted dehydrogenase